MVQPVIEVVKENNGAIDEETRCAWVTLYDVVAQIIDIFREKL